MKPLVFLLHPSIRARAYLQRSLASGVGPDVVVRLGDDDADRVHPEWHAPHDASFDPAQSLRETTARHGLDEQRVFDADVNAPAVALAIGDLDPELVVFTGGGILRSSTLEAAPAWLHVHPGRLPDRRGSTCIHYGLLLDGVVEASAMLMRAGLDAGPVLHARRFAPRPEWTARGLDHVDDAWIRSGVLVEALQRRHETKPTDQDGTPCTFFVVHPVLKHLALGVARDTARAPGQSLEAIPS